MTEIYSHRLHSDIPKRVRNRIIANVESIIEQAGFIDDTQEDPDLGNFNPGGSK